MKRLFYLAITFSFVSSVTAQDVTTTSQTVTTATINENLSVSTTAKNVFYVCKREREVRWLRIFMTDSNSKCKTIYSKEGYVQVVSSATYFSSCESVLLNVKKNIEDGGFKCQQEQLGAMIEIE